MVGARVVTHHPWLACGIQVEQSVRVICCRFIGKNRQHGQGAGALGGAEVQVGFLRVRGQFAGPKLLPAGAQEIIEPGLCRYVEVGLRAGHDTKTLEQFHVFAVKLEVECGVPILSGRAGDD